MKIRQVTAHLLRYAEPHDHGAIRHVTLARVETEDGTVGWGECISQFPESCRAAQVIVEEGYAPLLIGKDAMEVEARWHDMTNRTWWYGPEGSAAFALSAVDMALWDIKGKLLGLPVCSLIGGRLRDRVTAMGSIHLDMENLDWTVDEFRFMADAGYPILKGGWGTHPDAVFGTDAARDLLLVRRIREAVGEEPNLVLDVLGGRVKWDLHTAIERITALEECRLLWIEEPLLPRDYRSHRLLRDRIHTRIGTGEQEWTPEGYARLIQAGGVDVVQLDPGRCQGITGCRKAIGSIESANLKFSMHSWSSALNTAASVHLLASSHAGWCLDFKPHPSPMQNEIVSDPWIAEAGSISVRDLPGLGVTVLEDAVQRFSF